MRHAGIGVPHALSERTRGRPGEEKRTAVGNCVGQEQYRIAEAAIL